MAHRPEMFGPTRGFFGGWPIQWDHAKCCGLTLVAMATKFGLGAEIQSLTGLSSYSFIKTILTERKSKIDTVVRVNE